MIAFANFLVLSAVFGFVHAEAQAGSGIEDPDLEAPLADVLELQQLKKDAICYAKRYYDLFKGYCHEDESQCDYPGLEHHYENHGKTVDLIWGCRDRDIVYAKAVAFTETDEDEQAPELHVLVFETDPEQAQAMIVASQSLAAGIKFTVFGLGSKFEGFGTKWQIVPSLLESMPSNALAAIVDGRDVLLNIHKDDPNQGHDVTDGFVNAFQALTSDKPGSVVMSTEGQCCVAALTYVKPGDYFDATGNRKERACASGEEGCLWAGDARKLPWEDFMHNIAKERTGLDLRDVYVNAGLVAGRPQDLLSIIAIADIDATEDDQAVMTDLMYNFPDKIVLDYAQQLFGNARWTQGMENGGCPFDRNPGMDTVGSLVHRETNTMPLFLHGPGKFFECLDFVADRIGHAELGDEKNGHLRQRRNLWWKRKNYWQSWYSWSHNKGSGSKKKNRVARMIPRIKTLFLARETLLFCTTANGKLQV